MTSGTNNLPVIVGISGGSGSILARRAIDRLLEMEVPVAATCSGGARQTWQQEISEPFKDVLAAWEESPWFTYYPIGELGAPIASGTFATHGMIVVPCSMASLAAIAHGVGSNLLHRAADVSLKEGRKLVLVPRETPLNRIHLKNMLAVTEAGAELLPAMPGFYHHPESIEDLVDMLAGRILDRLGVENTLFRRWQGDPLARYAHLED